MNLEELKDTFVEQTGNEKGGGGQWATESAPFSHLWQQFIGKYLHMVEGEGERWADPGTRAEVGT